jgi:hypothetical protein
MMQDRRIQDLLPAMVSSHGNALSRDREWPAEGAGFEPRNGARAHAVHRGTARLNAMERELGTAWRPLAELLKLAFVLVIIATSGYMIFASDGAMPLIENASSAIAWAERMDSLQLRGSFMDGTQDSSAGTHENAGMFHGRPGHAVLSAYAGPIRTGLILVHLLGLVLGVGSTVIMDLYFLRHLRRMPLDSTALALIQLGSRLVVAGLVLLWLSGIGFLLLYFHTDPGKLANPKMWAKITVVAMLTINGWFIHHRTIPALNARIGSTILKDGRMETMLFFMVPGALSFSGWSFATVLGTVRELNFVTPAETLLLAFFLFLAAVTTATFAMLAITRRPGDPQIRF